MPPRLTTSILDADAPAADDRDLVTALGARARAALAAGEVTAYRRCFAEADEITDPQRRYQADVHLVELGLAHARRGPRGVAGRLFAAVADAALDALERECREPLLLNYAAVACYELWALDAARILFEAARRLDPTLPDVERNLSETARRARGPRPRRPAHAATIPGFTRRAGALARHARPSTGLTLSLCMIVRDEEQMLGRCLAAAAPAVDEIVIVDTGSTDATVEIARAFGARVHRQPWTGSFAQARNAAIEMATGDWLLHLDADEVLVAEDATRLRELTGRTWREAFYLTETSFVGRRHDGAAIVNTTLRMLRNRPGYRYAGRIHEQIGHTLPTWAPGRVEHTSIRIEHYGYLGDVQAAKAKSARNLALLQRQALEGPPTAHLHFNLGCEHAAAGDPRQATEELTRAWAMLGEAGTRSSEEFAPALIAALARALRGCGRLGDAAARAAEGVALYPDFTDLVLEQAAAALAARRDDEARARYERCLTLGDAPARYGGRIGAGSYLPRLALARLALGRGEPGAARELLDWCIEHHPGFHGVVGPYVAARLGEGAAPERVAAELRERLTPLTVPARHALAQAFTHAGAGPAAETEYRRLLAEPGDRDAAAVTALAELALRRGDWPQAARLAAEIGDEDPRAGLACRIATCAHLAAGDAAGARDALDRGRLSSYERDTFQAWRAIAEGRAPRERLAVASVPLLGTLMEIMLGAGAQEPFAALRGLLASSRLPEREQRELLAQTQLRHGRLAGAATEWLAVCAREPDARARLGLARVAAAQGMAQDATVLATAALELDPGCADARRLLDGLRAAGPAVAGRRLDG